jgi:hypothetical protein
MNKYKVRITGIKVVSSTALILRVVLKDELGQTQEVVASLPLQGRGVYYTIKFLNNHLADAAGWVTDLSFKSLSKDMGVTFTAEGKVQLNNLE